MRAKTTLLVVLDGFGYRDGVEHNAIAAAETPAWDRFLANRPHTLVSASGVDVGLPAGQMGNSEVGHMNLGAGRAVLQDLSRIDRAVEQGELERNAALNRLFARVRASGGALHVLGLLSPGGVHSHEEQIFELLRVAARKGLRRICLHAFLDGRDTPPKSAGASLRKAQELLGSLGGGRIASITGRYYAMDRDRRWERVEKAYGLLVRGEAEFRAEDALEGLELAYRRGESDEFVQPTLIAEAEAEAEAEAGLSAEPGSGPESGTAAPRLTRDDAVVFMNFRADRARQLTRALTEPAFDDFDRGSFVPLADIVTLTRYADDIDANCAFEPPELANTLGEYLAGLGKRQLRIAETEKYAHVTFFFSGGQEQPFAGEERILVPSPRVATYDLQPEMNAPRVTDELVAAIASQRYDLIVCNYANGDMVGHTGVFDAAVRAVETLDACLGRLEEAITAAGGQMLVTADHGNVEKMHDAASAQPHTAHTSEPVPLVYVGPEEVSLRSGGTLADVAPTLLELMGLRAPAEMTGRSLLSTARIDGRAQRRPQ